MTGKEKLILKIRELQDHLRGMVDAHRQGTQDGYQSEKAAAESAIEGIRTIVGAEAAMKAMAGWPGLYRELLEHLVRSPDYAMELSAQTILHQDLHELIQSAVPA